MAGRDPSAISAQRTPSRPAAHQSGLCPPAMMPTMRSLWSWLLVSLLVLRGLLGDAMAMGIGMASAPAASDAADIFALDTQSSTVVHAMAMEATAAHSQHTIRSQRPGDTQSSVHATDTAADTHRSHCDPHTDSDADDASSASNSACTTCVICHSAASAPIVAWFTPLAVRHRPAISRSVRFASALLPPASKPPIF